MAKPSLTEIATRHQVFLEQLKTGEARKFSAVLKKADKAIIQILSALGEPDISTIQKSTLNALLRKLKKAQEVILLKNTKTFMDSLKEISASEAGFEQRALRRGIDGAGITVKSGSLNTAYAKALSEPLSATGELVTPFVKAWSDYQVAAVNNAVSQAWVNGQTMNELFQAVRGTRANGFNDGIIGTSRRHAESIARTAVQHTSSKARQAVWEANKDIVERYRYVATLDKVTSAKCRGLDGREFVLGKGPMPPVHINCRSTTVAVLPKELQAFEEGATRAARGTTGGKAPAKQTYYQWLQKQSAGFQDQAIGRERGKLLRSGKISATKFGKLSLDSNFKPRTLEQMQRIEPLLFE